MGAAASMQTQIVSLLKRPRREFVGDFIVADLSGPLPSRPVLPFCPFWLHTFIYLNSPELHCWLSSHPHCIKMLGLCFRVYVRRSQGAGTDPAKDSMPRACRRGQGLPSDLPKDSLCLHLVVIDCKFVVRKVFGMTLPKTACPRHAIVS